MSHSAGTWAVVLEENELSFYAITTSLTVVANGPFFVPHPGHIYELIASG